MSFAVVNVISLIMFALSVILIFVTDLLGVGIAFAVVWLVYTVAANLYLLTQGKRDQKQALDEPLERIRKVNHRGLFTREVTALAMQYSSIRSREAYMQKATDSMQELYARILEQAGSNIDSAVAYIESYDYITRPDPAYLRNLCAQGDQLVQRFNRLVEQLVDIDTNPTTLDMNYVDDVVSCLQEMQTMQ